MKLKGTEVEFEEDSNLINVFAQQYWLIKQEFIKENIPQTEKRFIDSFLKKHEVEINLEEFVELREYAETDYRDEATTRIQEETERGIITEM